MRGYFDNKTFIISDLCCFTFLSEYVDWQCKIRLHVFEEIAIVDNVLPTEECGELDNEIGTCSRSSRCLGARETFGYDFNMLFIITEIYVN